MAIPDAFEGGQVVAQARELNAALPIIARAHSEAEIEHLRSTAPPLVVMGEHEIAKAMLAASRRAQRRRTRTTPAAPSIFAIAGDLALRVRAV